MMSPAQCRIWPALCAMGYAVTDQRLTELGRAPPPGWLYDVELSVWYEPNCEVKER